MNTDDIIGGDEDTDRAIKNDDQMDVTSPTDKDMYLLNTNPDELKDCENFSSWKSFVEDNKSTCEDAESLVSSPESNEGDGEPRKEYGFTWTKRKRSFRVKIDSNCPSSEEEDLAHCLVMLANGTLDPLVGEPEESCASASKEDQKRRRPFNFMNSYKAQSLFEKTRKGMFECKTCKKVFSSHQALGGHRASHKKVKGCFAAKATNLGDEDVDAVVQDEFFPTDSMNAFQFNRDMGSNSKKKSKMHECSICHRVFSTGQALGGHKRCHWLASNNSPPGTSSLAKFRERHEPMMNNLMLANPEPLDFRLDLNLPAPVDNNNSSLQLKPEIFLLPWVDTEKKDDSTNKITNVDCEVDSEAKLKLSELKDINMNGQSSSPWLQVGFGSVSDQVKGDP